MSFTFDAATHTFTKGKVVYPSVTQVLAASGLCDYSFVAEERRKYFLERGRSVHWMLELEDLGTLNYRKVPMALRGYRRSYLEFKKNTGFFPGLVEWKFVSPLGFAGIVDRVGTFPSSPQFPNGSTAVLDFKTGQAASWTRYQLAAYAIARWPFQVARCIRRVALSLSSDGEYQVKEFKQSTFSADAARFLEELRRMNGDSRTAVEARSADGGGPSAGAEDF